MRAPNGNLLFHGTTGNDSLDFSGLADSWHGVDYVTLGGNDKVIGTIFDDTFTLGKEAEYIDGGSGFDTVIYANSTSGVSVDLNNIAQHGGFAEGDELHSVENVTGSQFDDALVGSAGANTLDGQGGNDKIYGGDGDDKLLGGDGNDFLSGDAGNDVLHGGMGNDVLSGGTGNDQLFGDSGDDLMRSGAGADAYDGGAGVDLVDYSAAASSGNNFGFTGVFVNLSTGAGALGDAAGDTYVNVENVRGSAYNDGLMGDDHDNALFGNGGDDIIGGGAGADYLDGGDGTDSLGYADSSAGVSIDLGANQASGGDATGDTILNFENVYGSNYVDVLLGSDGSNEIHGNGGNDTLVGRGGNDRIEGDAGNDLLVGGADSDTFVFIAANSYPGPHQGNDVIADYSVGTDHLEFWGNVVESVNDLHLVQSGSNTIISYNDGADPASITLIGVNVNQLLAHAQTDFLFT